MLIKRRVYAAVILVVVTMVAGCSSTKEIRVPAAPRPVTGSIVMKMQSGTYTIKIGDLIELSVLGYTEFQTSATVRESGAMMVPLVGELQAAGLTKQQLTDTLRKRLAEFIKGEPEITIGISSPARQRIAVLGSVTRQDNYSVTGEISLIEALAEAGGTTTESDLEHVRIIHNGNANDVSEVDLDSYLEKGNLNAIPTVQPGDIVYVPKKENVVRTFSDFFRDAVLLLGAFRLLY